MTLAQVSVLDLTVDQIEEIELALGTPVDKWDDLPSRMRLYKLVYKAATGEDAGALSLRELTAAVSLGEPEGADTENPTQPPTG